MLIEHVELVGLRMHKRSGHAIGSTSYLPTKNDVFGWSSPALTDSISHWVEWYRQVLCPLRSPTLLTNSGITRMLLLELHLHDVRLPVKKWYLVAYRKYDQVWNEQRGVSVNNETNHVIRLTFFFFELGIQFATMLLNE